MLTSQGERRYRKQLQLFQGPRPRARKEIAISGLPQADSQEEMNVHSSTTRRKGIDQRVETVDQTVHAKEIEHANIGILFIASSVKRERT